MAGILDPKSRFFDTFLTKEGRRQLANGEIRTRFVSFSDSLTAYDQSELGVIDQKDGSIFFEAMSRPQDQIVTENPSVVNMMELRNPSAQPAFLAKEIHNPKTNVTQTAMTNATMFGKEILVPPDGREILVVTSSGIDRKTIDYDPRSSFYISGSRSQELFYDPSVTGFKGWWIFDETVTQLNEFTEPAFLNFERSIVSSRTITHTNDEAGGPLRDNTTSITFSGNLEFAATQGDIIGFKDDGTGERIAYTVQTTISADSTNTLSVKFSPAFSVNLHQVAKNDKNSKRDAHPEMFMLASAVDSFHFLAANVSQNLSSSSPLSTNAAYMVYNSTSNTNVIDSTPVFDDRHLSSISELGKAYKTREDSFIQINLREKHYATGKDSEGKDLYGADWGAPPFMADSSTNEKNAYINQISVWFYIQSEGFDSGNEQTIMQLFYDSTKKAVEVFAANQVLKVRAYTNQDSNIQKYTELTVSSTGIESEKWHRVSLVYGKHAGRRIRGNDGQYYYDYYLHVTLDGDRRKSFRKIVTKNYQLGNMTDLILGANLENLSSRPSDNRRLKGFIQECQYYIKESPRKPKWIETRGAVPALLTGSINDKYNDEIKNLETSDIFNMSGMFPENAEKPSKTEVDGLVRYRSSLKSVGGQHVTLSGSKISVRDSLREWVHYNPIRNESALYFAGMGSKTYVKEQQLERGLSRTTVKQIVERAKMTMSGSLIAYRQLGLLQHVDLDVPVSGSAPLTIVRSRLVEKETETPGEAEFVRTVVAESDTTKFNTRLKVFPTIEPIYGKAPNNYSVFEPKSIETALGPASGRFLENAGTVFALEEIMDNELDSDELTFSSSRLPNYFLLPPIAADHFKFDHDGEPDSLVDFMSWREFLRRRHIRHEQDFDEARKGKIKEKQVTFSAARERYYELMESWYKTLIPEDTLRALVTRFGTSLWSDTNEGLMRYLTRDANVSGGGKRNAIDYPLEQFNEEILFTKTSLLNKSFIQMFEVAKEDGKATFTKLIIRDLGVMRKGPRGSLWRYVWGRDQRKFRGVASDPLSDNPANWTGLEHVFAFGKIIDKKTNPNVPGTEIYFFPLFTLAFDIEVN